MVRNLGILEKSEVTCCGITISQCHAIVEIGWAKQISLNELADLLGLDKSTMSRTINNIVENNLVIRETHTEDRRSSPPFKANIWLSYIRFLLLKYN